MGDRGNCSLSPSCIKHLGWSMLASEANLESLATARGNVARNKLEGYVTIEGVEDGELLKAIVNRHKDQRLHFSMCNPPFYRPGEKASNEVVGKPAEVQVAGGEVAFAMKMVEDSEALHDQVSIYTILLGHKSS